MKKWDNLRGFIFFSLYHILMALGVREGLYYATGKRFQVIPWILVAAVIAWEARNRFARGKG